MEDQVEEPGQKFRLSPGPVSYHTVRWNLPFHVFMNGNQVRFTRLQSCHGPNSKSTLWYYRASMLLRDQT